MAESNDERLVNALGQLRARFPDWRLGQLVCNVATWARGQSPGDFWEMEDAEFIAAVGRFPAFQLVEPTPVTQYRDFGPIRVDSDRQVDSLGIDVG